MKRLAGFILFFLLLQSITFAQKAGENNLKPMKLKINLETPKLSTPENNSSAITRSPTLNWKTINGASGFEIEVSTDPTFKNISFIPGEILTNSCKCIELKGDTKYYWRVRGLNEESKSGWSEIWNFRTSILGSNNDDLEIVKENLGPNVNSEFAEFSPVISPDGKTLYICRDRHPENYGTQEDHLEDIWYSKLLDNGQWGKAIHMGEPLNNSNNNFVCSVTPDGNTLLLGNIYKTNLSSDEGCSMAHQIKAGWSFPEKVNIKNYYNRSKFANFNLSNDGKTLLMSIQRNDSKGDRDIYVSFLLDGKDNRWSEPLNLGSNINTYNREVSPFLASDGITLYFSSDDYRGYGDLDIYVSRRLDDSWTNWTKPENLGPNINSGDTDAFFTIPASGEYAYFSSAHNSLGNFDIFRAKLPPDIQPKPVVLIFGKIFDRNTKRPLEAKVHYELLPQGTEIGLARSNPDNGEYKLTLPSGSEYGFRAEVEGFFPINDYIDASKTDKYTEIERNLFLVPINVGETIRMNNIFFEFNKYDLKPESFPELKRVIQFLTEYPNIRIEIAGHTDDIGTLEYNQTLSENRAKAVADYITNNGISNYRIEYKGYGKTKPIADNSSEQGMQMNRRVEFVITKK